MKDFFEIIRTCVAVIMWVFYITPSISTFIDEDTIIMGYGNLDYDFYYPLPNWVVRKIHGTISWGKLRNNNYKKIVNHGKKNKKRLS